MFYPSCDGLVSVVCRHSVVAFTLIIMEFANLKQQKEQERKDHAPDS